MKKFKFKIAKYFCKNEGKNYKLKTNKHQIVQTIINQYKSIQSTIFFNIKYWANILFTIYLTKLATWLL